MKSKRTRGTREKTRKRGTGEPAPRGFAARSRVLARLVSAAQIGELARRPISRYHFEKPVFEKNKRPFCSLWSENLYLIVNNPFSKKKTLKHEMKKRKNKLNERRSLIPWGFWMDFPAFYASLVRRDSTENEEEQSNDLVMCNEMCRHSSSFGFN